MGLTVYICSISFYVVYLYSKLNIMIFKFDVKLLKYQLIVLYSKMFGFPKYQYFWYEMAIKVRKEDIQKNDFL